MREGEVRQRSRKARGFSLCWGKMVREILREIEKVEDLGGIEGVRKSQNLVGFMLSRFLTRSTSIQHKSNENFSHETARKSKQSPRELNQFSRLLSQFD
jgi:hypothetical protein